ncbi:MAG TPA: DUF1266 domain-containing protein [Bacillota bacterium]|nr:DUF1266 domain-containing protein [Bacillota bacterium]
MKTWLFVLVGIAFLAGTLWGKKPKETQTALKHQTDLKESNLSDYLLWCLGLSGILTELNQFNHFTLDYELDAKEKDMLKQCLEEWWDIYNREDLLATLDWLGGEGGHNAEFMECALFFKKNPEITSADLQQMCDADAEVSFYKYDFVRRFHSEVGDRGILAWDYGRYVFLCRQGYTFGYLNEVETATLIEEAGMVIEKHFKSWAEFGENFIIGRRFWACDDPQNEKELYREAQDTYYELLSDSGAWTRVPWEWSKSTKTYATQSSFPS